MKSLKHGLTKASYRAILLGAGLALRSRWNDKQSLRPDIDADRRDRDMTISTRIRAGGFVWND